LASQAANSAVRLLLQLAPLGLDGMATSGAASGVETLLAKARLRAAAAFDALRNYGQV